MGFPPFPEPYWSYLRLGEKIRCCFWAYVAEPIVLAVDRLVGHRLPEDLRLLPFDVIHGYAVKAFFRMFRELVQAMIEVE